jgi:hypothetical protein
MTKPRKRKRVHRAARRKPKPGHIVAHNRRRRKGEILCHNHVRHTAATAKRGSCFNGSRMGPGERGVESLPVWMAS